MVGDEPHLLDAEEQRIYAAEIAFIRYGLDSAERRFQRVREARSALIGEGPVAGAVLAAGLWSGWCQIRMFAPLNWHCRVSRSRPGWTPLPTPERAPQPPVLTRVDLSTDTDPDAFDIRWHHWAGDDDVTALIDELAEVEAAAAATARRDAVRLEIIRRLSAAGLSQRVIADVLGLSHQRVNQLANAS